MRYLKKTCAITMSAAMVLGLAATAGNVSYAATNVEKEETVYVNQDATGSVEEVTVSNWLKNVTGTGDVEDVSNLKDIKNVKGEETFKQGSEGKLTWKADNEDIYYQGTTDEKPPVGVKISYQLDGKDVTAEDLAGKSGELTMTIQYENNSTFEDTVDGKKVEMNTPFLMASAVILPVDTFSEVTVSQGKLVSEGSNQILVAYGMPGLADSLNLSDDMKEEMNEKLGDTVTIKATVKDFEMGSIYTVASSSEFSDIDLDDDSDMNDLEDAVNDLADATDELISGSSDLSDGLTTLKDNFKTYANGVNTVSKGASDLSDGAGKLSQGVTQYTNGVTTLTNGTSQYVTGTNQLTAGVNQYVAGEQKIDEGVTTLYNGAKDFPTQYDTFHNNLSTYVSTVNALPSQLGTMMKGEISQQVGQIIDTYNNQMAVDRTDTVIQQAQNNSDVAKMISDTATALGLNEQQAAGFAKAMYQAIGAGAKIQSGVDQEVAKQTGAGVADKVSNTTIDLSSNEDFAKLIAGGNALVSASSDQIKPALTSVTGGIKSIYDGVKQLSNANQTLLDGASTLSKSGISLTEGIKSLTSNSKTLSSSAKELSKGATKLSKGASKLNGATKEVKTGVNKLQDGSVTLLDGMNQFKDEGTGKLQSEYNSKIKTVMDRFKAITKDADEYNTFSGISDDMNGSVKFIFQTEEIKNK
ncbi:MAG TPA: hypothetical protein DHV96_07155 [Lachnospiraceae bacterium]|nr:hypothetical protein [Lachnospiraceae bacterium]